MCPRVLTFLFLLVTAAGTAIPAWGQYPPELAAGHRVQLQSAAPGSERVMATMVEIHPDWFSYQPQGDSLVWSRRVVSIDTILVSEGRHRRRSALWGVAWGSYLGGSAAAIGGVLAAKSIHRDVGESIALGAVVGTLIGAPIGAAIGAILAPESWRTYLFSHGPER